MSTPWQCRFEENFSWEKCDLTSVSSARQNDFQSHDWSQTEALAAQQRGISRQRMQISPDQGLESTFLASPERDQQVEVPAGKAFALWESCAAVQDRRPSASPSHGSPAVSGSHKAPGRLASEETQQIKAAARRTSGDFEGRSLVSSCY